MDRNSYAAGHFELRIDGHQPTAYVRSIEGGWSRAHFDDEVMGLDSQRLKQISSVEIEPIAIELGLMGAKDMLRWIQSAWNRGDYQRRSGQITYADFDMRAMFEHQFSEALLTETTFPTLDGASKDGGYLKCTLLPESVTTTALGTPGPRISSIVSPLQKMWIPSAFRLNVDGLPDMQYVNKIDSFTVTMQTKKLYSGGARLPELVPLNVKFPNITGTISLQYAGQLLKWHQDYVRSQDGPGLKDLAAQKSGSIEFLSPDRKQTIFRINLHQVGLLYVGTVPAKANEEQIKRLKFELYVQRMSLEGSSILGFV